jgi:hypothetical protein
LQLTIFNLHNYVCDFLPKLIHQFDPQFVVLIGQVATTLVFALVVFKIPCHGPVGWVIVLTLLQGTAGMCFGKGARCYVV